MLHRIGIAGPQGFPNAPFDDILESVQAFCTANPVPVDRLVAFNEAWNGLAYRVTAAHDSSDEYSASFAGFGSMPPPEERYKQERALFNFFANALSALETMGRGQYVIGSLLIPTAFTKNRPYLQDVYRDYLGNYPTEAVTTELARLIAEPQFIVD